MSSRPFLLDLEDEQTFTHTFAVLRDGRKRRLMHITIISIHNLI